MEGEPALRTGGEAVGREVNTYISLSIFGREHFKKDSINFSLFFLLKTNLDQTWATPRNLESAETLKRRFNIIYCQAEISHTDDRK